MSAPIAELRHATVRAGGRVILKHVHFAVQAGETVALVGPNGCGKTTLARALLGLQALSAGSAFMNGAALRDVDMRARARAVSYLPQARAIAWALTVEDVVALARFAYGARPGQLVAADAAAVEAAITRCGLEKFRTRTIDTLSGGELARVHAARALAQGALLLVADEPEAGLDPAARGAVLRALSAESPDAARLFVLHDLGLAETYAQRIVLMAEGKILADGPAGEVLTQERVSAAFGADALRIDTIHGPSWVFARP
jgi:iron complex transport system ATP-binding protein